MSVSKVSVTPPKTTTVLNIMALPLNNHRRHLDISALGPSYGVIARYVVSSSDVVGEPLRINVSEQGSNELMWVQERSLIGDEVVETLKPPSQDIALWSTHRPTKGWYIRFKSPQLPPNFSIPLLPFTAGTSGLFSNFNVPEGSMTFVCRTQADMSRGIVLPNPSSTPTAQLSSIIDNPHSYPPPPSPVTSPRGSISASPVSSITRVDEPILSSSSRPYHVQVPATQLTHFLVSPQLAAADGSHQPRSSGSKIWGALRTVLAVDEGKSFSIQTQSLPPLLRFQDTTRMLSVRTSGVIELDEGVARVLGVDPSFYIAVALAFLEFLSDKEHPMDSHVSVVTRQRLPTA